MGWMRARYGGGVKEGGLTVGLERGGVWGEVVRAVAKGSDVALKRAKAVEGEMNDHEIGGKEVEEIVARRDGREAITFGMRTGEVEGVVHGERWRKYAKGGGWKGNRYTDGGTRGCPAGCGVRCTLKHVVMGECAVCAKEDRVIRLAELQRTITEIDEAVVRPSGVARRKGVGD